MNHHKPTKYPPTRIIYDDKNKVTQKRILTTWRGATGKSERSFYYRLDHSNLEDYLIFSKVLDIPIEQLLGREVFAAAVQMSTQDLATSLKLSKPKA